MSLEFRVTQTDQFVGAVFTEPIFGLLRDSIHLFELVHRRFSASGLDLGDMRLESGDGSLADAHLQFGIPVMNSRVRVYINRVEIDSRVSSIAEICERHAVRQTLDVIRELGGDRRYEGVRVRLAAHGSLQGGVTEFMSRFVTGPLSLGPPRGAGCVLYFGPEGPLLSSSITMDRSVVIEEGLCLVVQAMVDGDHAEGDALMNLVSSHCGRVFQQLDLALAKETT